MIGVLVYENTFDHDIMRDQTRNHFYPLHHDAIHLVLINGCCETQADHRPRESSVTWIGLNSEVPNVSEPRGARYDVTIHITKLDLMAVFRRYLDLPLLCFALESSLRASASVQTMRSMSGALKLVSSAGIRFWVLATAVSHKLETKPDLCTVGFGSPLNWVILLSYAGRGSGLCSRI